MNHNKARDTFSSLVEASNPNDVMSEEVLTALENSADVMPSSLCADLDVPAGSTFGFGVKAWRDASEAAADAVAADAVAFGEVEE